MSAMFCYCESFNQDLSSWDVSNVEDMQHMFNGCTSFNQDLSSWDVSKVRYLNWIFKNCSIEEKYKPKFE
jgi:surface protein